MFKTNIQEDFFAITSSVINGVSWVSYSMIAANTTVPHMKIHMIIFSSILNANNGYMYNQDAGLQYT